MAIRNNGNGGLTVSKWFFYLTVFVTIVGWTLAFASYFDGAEGVKNKVRDDKIIELKMKADNNEKKIQQLEITLTKLSTYLESVDNSLKEIKGFIKDKR